SRVASAAWRPQPMASAGGRARSAANSAPQAPAANGRRRGASQRHGARGCSTQAPASAASAHASAVAWRALPARPSLTATMARALSWLALRPVARAWAGGIIAGTLHWRLSVSNIRGNRMPGTLSDAALARLFREARTHNAIGGEVDDDTLRALYDLLKFGPTEANACPARFVFVRSPEAKAK